MPQHACIAIGIDRYRYMQSLRYALEDAREFHAAIAQLDASETGETSLNLGTLNGWSQTGVENGNGNDSTNGNSPIAPSIATLTPLTISVSDDDPPHHDRHLLLTETSPQVGDRSTYPTRETILHALYRWTRDTVTPDQTLWCFFSGYGLEVDGIDYLLPIEGNPNRLDETAIPIETVFDALAAAPTDRVVLILDINRPTSADRDSDIGLQTYTLAKTRNIPTILSCQPHQRSYETRDLRHGLFSAILLESLRHRKCPTLESLDRYLTDRVPELCDLHLQPIQNPLLAVGAGVPSPFVLLDVTTRVTPGLSDPQDKALEVPPPPDPECDLALAIDPESSPSITADPIDPESSPPQNPTESPPLPPKTIGNDVTNTEVDSTRDVDDRSLLGLGSSLVVWIGLLGSVLGLGVWLNGQVSDRAIEPDQSESMPSQIAPSTTTPPANTTAPVTSNSTDSTTVEQPLPVDSSNLNNSEHSDPKGTLPPTSQTNPTPQTQTSDQSQTPPPNPAPIAASSSEPLASKTPAPTPALEPSAIASMYSLQASPLSAAILQARRLTPQDAGYSSRKQNIERWGTTIFEIAQSRADRGQWMLAIAAARLVPPELNDLRQRTDRSIQWWTQAQVNEQIIAAARKMIVPNQASSYWRAIKRLRTIEQGQPFDDAARVQVETWATNMVTIARQRAANGQIVAAIQAAQLVPHQTAAHADAQREIARWRSLSP